jgi:hypothetical protein
MPVVHGWIPKCWRGIATTRACRRGVLHPAFYSATYHASEIRNTLSKRKEVLMDFRNTLLACSILSALLLACGASEPLAPTAEESAISLRAGRYDVSGVTKTLGNQEERRIEGTVMLSFDADGYTTIFDLSTTLPGSTADHPANVIGKGEGMIDGSVLTGTTRTQIVASTVPGVDPGFAFVPRAVSTRIVSDTTATLRADGTLTIDIRSRAAEGHEYASTVTTLTGVRVPGIGELPDVAAPPPK